MRRQLADSSLKAKIHIEQIGGRAKSLSEYGRVWTWIAYFLKQIPNMSLKISISQIFENFIFFSLTHTVHLHPWRGSSKGDDHEISPFLASKSYQNINFDQIKNRDINLMIICLIFYQNCNFHATHVDARSRNGDFLLSSVESSRCAGNWQIPVWNLKSQIEKIGGFTKSLSEYGRFWTWIAYFLKLIPNMNLKISIPKICENLIFPLNPHRAFVCVEREQERKSYQNINVDQIKNRDINLMIIYLIFYQNCNFLATHVDARSQNGDFLLSSVESSRCASN